MNRITITLEDDLTETLSRFMKERGYLSRSEAVRDLLRVGFRQTAEGAGAEGPSTAVVAYVFDHRVRDLAARLTARHHDRHDLTIATTLVHLDHDTCMAVVMLRGDASDIRQHCDGIFSERGVRHGRLHLIAVRPETERHSHGPGPAREHVHLKVRDGF